VTPSRAGKEIEPDVVLEKSARRDRRGFDRAESIARLRGRARHHGLMKSRDVAEKRSPSFRWPASGPPERMAIGRLWEKSLASARLEDYSASQHSGGIEVLKHAYF